MAVLLTNSLRTALVAWLGGAKQRIGYVRYGRGPLLTGKLYPRRVGRRSLPMPMVETYLELARALGCGEESPRLELATVEADERSADARLRAAWSARRRPRGRAELQRGLRRLRSSGRSNTSAELARRIVDELDHDVLVMCGPKERDIARQVVELAGSRRVFSMADQPMDLGTAKACIRRCRLMVSTDSGPRHVAAAFGPAGGHAVRPDAARLEREPHAAGGQPGARSGLHRLPQAGLSAGPSSLHARPDGRHGVCGRP